MNSSSLKNKGKNYFDLARKEQNRIVKKAIKMSNKMQRDIVFTKTKLDMNNNKKSIFVDKTKVDVNSQDKKQQGVKPTKEHSMRCSKLYGGNCNCRVKKYALLGKKKQCCDASIFPGELHTVDCTSSLNTRKEYTGIECNGCGKIQYYSKDKDGWYKIRYSHYCTSPLYTRETVEHFVTVIGCMASEEDGWFSKKSYKKALEYTKSYIQEGLSDQKNQIREKLIKKFKRQIPDGARATSLWVSEIIDILDTLK